MIFAPFLLGIAISTLAGVTLGDDASTLVSQHGDPLFVEQLGTLSQYAYMYGDGSAMEYVLVRHGRVVGVTLEGARGATAAGFDGVHLGDRTASLATTLPAAETTNSRNTPAGTVDSATYELDGHTLSVYAHGGIVTGLAAMYPVAAADALTPGAEPALHEGRDIASAIVLMADKEDAGVRSEYIYLAHHPCATGGTYKMLAQHLRNAGYRAYDVLHVRCSSDASERDFYFDITGFFGKM